MITEATWLTTNPKTGNLDIKAKATYRNDGRQFNGQPCYGIYSEKTKKVVGGDNITSWEFSTWISVEDFDKTIDKLRTIPAANLETN